MIKYLDVVLGHSNLGITMNLYVDITEDEKTREISMIEDYLKIGKIQKFTLISKIHKKMEYKR